LIMIVLFHTDLEVVNKNLNNMWAFLTITACTFIIAITVHDCYMAYLDSR
jgi:hypothetical protein